MVDVSVDQVHLKTRFPQRKIVMNFLHSLMNVVFMRT